MFFQQVVHADLGCASYVIASSSGEALVVDPRWEIEPYLDIAADHGFTISRVVETHNHADHVSGHGKLAAQTGARILVHEAADVEFDHVSLRDGDVIDMGDVRVHVIHTPGHRPEHIALAVEDVTRGAEPWLILTGDSLFVGDVARPDLAVDGQEGARLLFDSLHSKLLVLPEFAAVYPAHVAGSLCGRVSSEVLSTTLGYEKRYNHALEIHDRDGFVQYMNENLPQRPPNMARIVRENRGHLRTVEAELVRLDVEGAAAAEAAGAVPLDVRATDEYLQGHVPRSIHVSVSGPQFGTRAGFVLPGDAAIMIVARDEAEARRALTSLRVVAFENVAGWVAFSEWKVAGKPVASIRDAEPHDVATSGSVLLDVREPSEWAEGMAPGAIGIPYREVGARSGEIPNGATVAVTCQSGGRSAIAASLLERAGFANVTNVAGGMTAWSAAGLPVSG